jgi:hypothetical protein
MLLPYVDQASRCKCNVNMCKHNRYLRVIYNTQNPFSNSKSSTVWLEWYLIVW